MVRPVGPSSLSIVAMSCSLASAQSMASQKLRPWTWIPVNARATVVDAGASAVHESTRRSTSPRTNSTSHPSRKRTLENSASSCTVSAPTGRTWPRASSAALWPAPSVFTPAPYTRTLVSTRVVITDGVCGRDTGPPDAKFCHGRPLHAVTTPGTVCPTPCQPPAPGQAAARSLPALRLPLTVQFASPGALGLGPVRQAEEFACESLP